MTMFIAEHNLSFNLLEHLPKLMQACEPDSTVLKKVRCDRKKGTQIIKEIIGPANTSNISTDLINNQTPYSIIIDEATDISVKKSMAVNIVKAIKLLIDFWN